MLSVYTRHHPDCKNAGDKTWRRCSCPKWIWGSLNGKFLRHSAETPRWEEAEELRHQLSEGLLQTNHPAAKTYLAVDAPIPRRENSNWDRPQKPRVTVEATVGAYLRGTHWRKCRPILQASIRQLARKAPLAAPVLKIDTIPKPYGLGLLAKCVYVECYLNDFGSHLRNFEICSSLVRPPVVDSGSVGNDVLAQHASGHTKKGRQGRCASCAEVGVP